MLFDSHAHYDDARFDADRFDVLDKMPQNNVGLIMNACAAMSDIDRIIEMCNRYDFMYGSVGVHPSDCEGLTEADMERLKKESEHEKIKAIGEIGLDYYYDDVPRDVQKKWFARQIELAKEVKMPIVVHDRDAHQDTVDIMRSSSAKDVGGVLHCFSGSCDMARDILDMGFYIAFGGTLTFKNARRAVEAAEYVPIDRILIETDSPYLAPVPERGKRNDSTLVKYVAEKLAEIKGIDAAEVERITFENAKKLFNI
ncbi:MAG: TatD family hydrolase [Eubacteriales bacterium]|nr:TatD family hydrolase [Eubacteriales bacterium]